MNLQLNPKGKNLIIENRVKEKIFESDIMPPNTQEEKAGRAKVWD